MAQYTYRGNLSQPNYPFLASQQGRTVIVSNLDQTYVVGLNADGQFDKQKEVPAAYYMENVLPSDEGYRSIGYDQMVSSAGANLVQIIPVPDPKSTVGFIGFGTDSKYYVGIRVTASTYVWSPIGTYNYSVTYLTNISTAYINGVFYFYIPQIGCFKYNVNTNAIDSQVLTGLDSAAVKGIATAFGYMIAYTKSAIAWSSLADPTDFTPDLKTGAGGGVVQEARGDINFIYAIYQGFIIYCASNVVAASYTGNTRFPFNLRELVGSGGISDRRLIAFSETGESHYAYTTNGLQEIALRGAVITQPAFTDFLSGGVIEEFDSNTGTFTVKTSDSPINKKLAMCGNRFLVMSYGVPTLSNIPEYKYAIVFDLALKRYGKLKIDHYDMFSYYFLNTSNTEIFDSSQLVIAIQTYDGGIKVVNTKNNASNSNGLILLGKFQADRNHLIQLVSVDIEDASPTCKVSNIYSYDGKNTLFEDLEYTQIASGGLLRKLTRRTAVNHSIMIKGSFSLNTFIMSFWIHGRR